MNTNFHLMRARKKRNNAKWQIYEEDNIIYDFVPDRNGTSGLW